MIILLIVLIGRMVVQCLHLFDGVEFSVHIPDGLLITLAGFVFLQLPIFIQTPNSTKPRVTGLGAVVRFAVTLQTRGRSIRIRSDNQLPAIEYWRRFPCMRERSSIPRLLRMWKTAASPNSQSVALPASVSAMSFCTALNASTQRSRSGSKPAAGGY